jgi:hypothetical protein
MAKAKPVLSAEETARRGDTIYENKIRAQVEPAHEGKVVAIDVHTEAFEIADTALAAGERLLARLPDAEIWFIRIGDRALHRIGGHSLSRKR